MALGPARARERVRGRAGGVLPVWGMPGALRVDQLLVAHWSGPGGPNTHVCLVPGVSCARSGDALEGFVCRKEPGAASQDGSSVGKLSVPRWHRASLGVLGAPHSSWRGVTCLAALGSVPGAGSAPSLAQVSL